MPTLFDSARQVSRNQARSAFVTEDSMWWKRFKKQNAPLSLFVSRHRAEIDEAMRRKTRLVKHGFEAVGAPRWMR